MKTLLTTFCTLIALFAQIGINAQTIVWKQLASLPVVLGGEAVVLNEKIYFTAANSDTTGFYMYDPSKDTWKKLTSTPTPAVNSAVAAVGGKLYMIGGDPFTNINYEYTPESDTWKTLAPMPTNRQHIDCGIIDNKIYITGGLTSWTTFSKKTEVYDPLTNTWTEKSPIPTLRNNPAIVTQDSLIYVIGGAGSISNIWQTIKTVECYNANTDQWSKKSDLPFVLFKPGAVVVNNKIVVLGGQNSSGKSVTSVLIYDAVNDTWKNTTPLPKINCFAGYASIGNKIYVIGGTTSDPDWKWYTDVYEGTISDSVASSIDINQIGNNLSIFPNPTKAELNISISGVNAKTAIVQIINLDGKLIFSSSFKNNSIIDLTGKPKGIYILNLCVDGVKLNKKISIE